MSENLNNYNNNKIVIDENEKYTFGAFLLVLCLINWSQMFCSANSKHLMTGPNGSSEFCFPKTRGFKWHDLIMCESKVHVVESLGS